MVKSSTCQTSVTYRSLIDSFRVSLSHCRKSGTYCCRPNVFSVTPCPTNSHPEVSVLHGFLYFDLSSLVTVRLLLHDSITYLILVTNIMSDPSSDTTSWTYLWFWPRPPVDQVTDIATGSTCHGVSCDTCPVHSGVIPPSSHD